MDVLLDYWPDILRGARTTVVLTFVSCAIGLAIGLVLATCRVSPIRPLRAAAAVFTGFMVNIPIAVWIILFYFGFSKVGITYSAFASAIIVLATYVGAYMGEAIRSGINTVPNGQAEAARAIGLSFPQVLRHVIMPQAVRSVVGPLGVILNATYRNAAVASFIDVRETTYQTGRIIDETARAIPPLIGGFLVFLVLGLGTSAVFRIIEEKVAVKR